jgi:hypothetical protein
MLIGKLVLKEFMSTIDLIFISIAILLLIITGRSFSKKEKAFAVTKQQFLSKYSFKEEGSIYRELHKHGFSLFERTNDDYEISSVVSKIRENEGIYIFDFKFTCKYSDNSNAGRPSVIRAAFVTFNQKKLFEFEILPEGLWEKTKQLFGAQDLDFEEYPEFSKKYVLKGRDTATIRNRFPRALIKDLENKEGVCIEGRENCVLVYNESDGQFSDYEKLYKNTLLFNQALR